MEKMYEWLKGQLIWNSILRFFIQQYMTLYLSSLINVVKVSHTKSPQIFFQVDFNFSFNGTSASALTSLLLLALCTLLPIATFCIIWKYRVFLDSKTFQERYGTLVEGLKIKNVWHSLYHTMQLLKWCITITLLVMLRDYPAIQIVSIIPIQLSL